jgi:hypothetical protein
MMGWSAVAVLAESFGRWQTSAFTSLVERVDLDRLQGSAISEV